MTKPLPWHVARSWQTNTALLLIGACMLGLARQLVSEYDHFTIGFSGVSGYSVTLYIAACLLILTSPVDRLTFPIILAVAIVCRLVTIYPDPFLSSDVYRYVWDGIVQNAHINPYRYVPGDPALTFLRAPNQDIFDSINRRDYARTIYPPAAQFLFCLITFISPTLTFMKSAMVLFEGLTMYALIALLKHMGARREQALLYAWCPVLIWEIAGSGHLDSIAMAFISLALLFRYRRKPVVTGIFLGLAVLTKLYPIVLLPALMMRARSLPEGQNLSTRGFSLKGWDWKLPATAFALIAAGYAAYSSVGILVFGFFGGYVQEEGLRTGTRYFLLELAHQLPGMHPLPTAAFYVLCLVVFGGLTIWALKVAAGQGTDRAAFLHPALGLAFALMILFSPHYAWYIIWLVPFFTLTPSLTLLVYVAGFFYGYTTELADPGPKMFLLNKYLYAAVFAAALVEIALRRWPVYRPYLVQPTPDRES